MAGLELLSVTAFFMSSGSLWGVQRQKSFAETKAMVEVDARKQLEN